MSHPAIGAGNNRKFAFIRVGYAKAPRGACDLLTTLSKGIFLCHTMSHNNTPKDVSLDRSLDIINAMSALDCAIQRADKITRSSGNSYAREEFSEKSHDTMLALGLALYEQLSTIYKEEQL